MAPQIVQPENKAASDPWKNAEKTVQGLFNELKAKYHAKVPEVGALLDADQRLRYDFKLQLVRSKDVTKILDNVIQTLTDATRTSQAGTPGNPYEGVKWQYLITNIQFKANNTESGATTGVGNLEFSVTYRYEKSNLKETVPRKN